MAIRNHNHVMAAVRRQEQISKILQILQENKQGLTSVQIGVMLGTGLPRTLLAQLQQDGLIRKRRGYSPKGIPSFLYVLNKAGKA